MKLVLQSQASECALACLAMIASGHGLHLGLSELRRRFPISLKGANLGQMILHAGAVGLSARPLRLELNEIGRLELPCVLHWDLNHFVVLKKVVTRQLRRGAADAMLAGYVVILDPAVGERR